MTQKRIIAILIAAFFFSSFSFAQEKNQTPERISQEVAENWILFLDQQKYAESWEKLSPNTKVKLEKRQWELAMLGMRKPLGKLKIRKLDKVEYIKSLKGYPDQEGGIVTFDSSFEGKASVRETVGTIHDKDGKWRVVAYLTN